MSHSGTTIVGIIGHPVKHSLSPDMHNAEFERLGLDWRYEAWDIPPEGLGEGLRELQARGVKGFNVTIPHKVAVMEFLGHVEYDAQLVGAVNTVICSDDGMGGFNTDLYGWIEDVEQDVSLEGQRVCIVGAGGSARAVCVGARQQRASHLLIVKRPENFESAEELAATLRAKCPGITIETCPLDREDAQAKVAECGMVVNTTPAGMASSPGIPIEPEWLHSGQYVYDLIYNPAETELLKAAAAKGCRTRNGLGMLARQGAIAFKLWTRQPPDVARMMETLRSRLY